MAVRHLVWVAAGISCIVAGCSGGGGTNAFQASATLLAVTFPDPNDVNLEAPDSAPQNAPLVQPVVFTFSAAPDPARINATVLPIVDEASNLPAAGRYVIDGAQVTFVPDLPLRAVGLTSSGALDDGGAGLDLNRAYTVRVGPKTFAFVAGVAPALRAKYPDPVDGSGLFLKFRTMPALTADSFRALVARAPRLVATDPVDGATGISPNFFSDPDALFPERRAFQLLFDAPINPDSTVLNDTVFQLIDLDDRPALFPNGLPLGIDVRLVENRIDRAVVEITPSGILPLGHLLALEFDVELKGLSEKGTPAGGPRLTTFTTAADPGGALRDSIVETFDTNEREERDIAEIGNGNLPADWNRDRSGILQAALEFDGTGVLGRFVPAAPGDGGINTIVLDTASQTFPLPDGSTPDAPPGYVVKGGVFHFTDVDIADGVEIKAAGGNPLVFKCTGSVRIAGDLLMSGQNGSSEFAYDSAITALPGGPATAGGGRGGDSHPVTFFPPDTINYLTLVSPQWAAAGYGIDPADGVMKRIGGTGAQSGNLDQKKNGKFQTDHELNGECQEFRQGHADCKIPGGGGGSLLGAGATPSDNFGNVMNGISNVHPDGAGGWIVLDDETCLAGVGGAHPFADDGTTSNDFYGKLGQLRRLVGGQGGGGGGTLCDNYYCGDWCMLDTDPANDACCNNGDNMRARGRAPSVGDSRGGAGGGGGGAFLLQSLDDITVEATGSVLAFGGNGGGGEGISCSYWGGGGGGGAGGAIVLQSAATILVKAGAVLDVRRGVGDNASPKNEYDVSCDDSSGGTPGDGGDGGHGLIQLQVPAGTVATVVHPGTTDTNGSLRPPSSWIDPTNTLAPVEFTPASIALSKWYDFGRVIARGGGLPTFAFGGLDSNGFVVTDGAGNVLSPATTDILCGYLGQIDPLTKTYLPGEEPRANFIPRNAKVKVEFQGADAIVAGSKEVDPATITAWSPDVTTASGRQFLRWRVTFDTTADGSNLTPSTRRPIVERLELHADF